MDKNDKRYCLYLTALKEELVPALGCTEPIAIALASAKARDVLGEFPDKIIAACSGNIIKNVKGVIVPTTGDMRGIETSAILGAVGGNAQKLLEVLAEVRPEHIEKTRELLKTDLCQVEIIQGTANLNVIITAKKGPDSALVEIKDKHTNIIRIEKNGKLIFSKDIEPAVSSTIVMDRTQMNIKDIYDFANSVEIEDVKQLLDTQIDYNTKIAEEGLNNSYGANVGSTLIKCYGSNIDVIAKAYPAAGSDARMSGCILPVVINSGSGNQGMTVSLPIIKYAQYLGVSKEKLYRALVLGNLTAIHQKTAIGSLSAYCGAVSAACGSGVGIAYLHNESIDIIKKTIVNTLANVSGIVCDGAKPSCAAKIASSVDAALLGYNMAVNGQFFRSGEGLVKDTVEDTIRSCLLYTSPSPRDRQKSRMPSSA
jgi:L-cysteine desulfidase